MVPGRWQAFGQAVVRTVVAMTPSQDPPVGDQAEETAALLDRLAVAQGFPAVALLEALQVARTFAVTSATHPSTDADGTEGLLAGLHLDLAAAEIADVSGSGPPDPVEEPQSERVDAGARSAGRQLVDRCASLVQARLDQDPAGFDAEQLLACTRAVLHLDAARRAWPDDVAPGRVP